MESDGIARVFFYSKPAGGEALSWQAWPDTGGSPVILRGPEAEAILNRGDFFCMRGEVVEGEKKSSFFSCSTASQGLVNGIMNFVVPIVDWNEQAYYQNLLDYIHQMVPVGGMTVIVYLET